MAIPALNSLISSVASGGEVEIDVNIWQGIAIAAVAGGLIALISFGQNAVEDKTGKALLK